MLQASTGNLLERETMKTVLRFFALVVIGLGWQGAMLRADGGDGLIHPGDPTVHPSYSLSVPSFDHLIPTTVPVIHSGDPTVRPWQNLTHSINNPLRPTGAAGQ